jgi:hypothetical protein
LSDGRQALITCGFSKEVCAFLFSAEGDYLCLERRKPRLNADLVSNKDSHVRELYAFLSAEFGFAPDLIRIKRFAEPTESVSVQPLPQSLRQFAESPAEADADEYLCKLEELRRWVDEEAFVLNTWNDYWLDASGKVTDS